MVFMGMGEPLLNLDNVLKAIRLLNDAQGQQIGIRRITVSTCGIVPKLQALAQEHLDVVLAVSLHAPNDEQRSAVMPVNRQYPLEKLMAACRAYQRQTHNRISFEYALIAGFNDQPLHVRQLQQLFARAGLPPQSHSGQSGSQYGPIQQAQQKSRWQPLCRRCSRPD